MLITETENVKNRIRKYYRLTDAGRKEAESLRGEFGEYLDLMQTLIKK